MSSVQLEEKKVTKILSHEAIHIDEAGALFLLTTFPCSKYPGAVNAKIDFIGTGGQLKKSPEEYRNEGTLLVGIGGGELDEHAPIDGQSKEDECCMTLVAKHMGLSNDPALKDLLAYIKRVDRTPTCTPYELPTLMKEYAAANPGDTLGLWKMVKKLLHAKWWGQNEFHKCGSDLRDECFAIINCRGKELQMVAVESDNTQMNKYVRAKYPNCAVILQRQSSGNCQVFTNKKFHQFLNVERMVTIIRSGEMFHRGVQIPLNVNLAAEGRITGAECWWYQAEAGNMYNGSLTAKDVEPTRIPWNELRKVVYNEI